MSSSRYIKSDFPIDQIFKKKFEARLRLFLEDSTSSILKDHPLGGKMIGKKAFSVTGDIRVLYYIYDETAYFVDIGTHNQVYGK